METINPHIVGAAFVRQYYKIMREKPDQLHRFYESNSRSQHGGPDKPQTSLANAGHDVEGQRDIHRMLMRQNYKGSHIKIERLDCQPSGDETVIAQVMGDIQKSNYSEPMPRRFVQTFVLIAKTPRKYYIRNDIFRYTDMESEISDGQKDSASSEVILPNLHEDSDEDIMMSDSPASCGSPSSPHSSPTPMMHPDSPPDSPRKTDSPSQGPARKRARLSPGSPSSSFSPSAQTKDTSSDECGPPSPSSSPSTSTNTSWTQSSNSKSTKKKLSTKSEVSFATRVRENMKYNPDFQKPDRLDNLMVSEAASREVQMEHSWNDDDRSDNIFTKSSDSRIFYRHPVAQSTDGIRGKVGFTCGLHVWQIHWNRNERGTHAVVGVTTIDAPLHCVGYQLLLGANSESWGWDLARNKLFHNFKRTRRSVLYPSVLTPGEKFTVPEDLMCVLDMDAGTLGFMLDGQYLGVAFRGLSGKKLYPAIATVWGHCEINMRYIGGLDPEPLRLLELCRSVVRKKLGKKNLKDVDNLPIPGQMKEYLLYQK